MSETAQTQPEFNKELLIKSFTIEDLVTLDGKTVPFNDKTRKLRIQREQGKVLIHEGYPNGRQSHLFTFNIDEVEGNLYYLDGEDRSHHRAMVDHLKQLIELVKRGLVLSEQAVKSNMGKEISMRIEAHDAIMGWLQGEVARIMNQTGFGGESTMNGDTVKLSFNDTDTSERTMSELIYLADLKG